LSDESGDVAKELFLKAGHEISHAIIDDSKSMIRLSLAKALYEENKDSVVFLGGTGLSPRDVTIEAVVPLLEKQLDGFGEIFRRLSYDSIGSPALMTRTVAGTIGSKVVFCLPGSPDATKLGVELLLKELPHAVFIAGSKP
jgi:molybdopterin adenylyltransferase